MLRFLLLRLARALLTIALVVSFAFVVLRLSGDPALLIMSVDAPPEAVAAFRKAWGLDEPLWRQYLSYFGAIASGDLGRSMRDGRDAIVLVGERIPATLALTVPALTQPLWRTTLQGTQPPGTDYTFSVAVGKAGRDTVTVTTAVKKYSSL